MGASTVTSTGAINIAPGNSSNYKSVIWASFDSGANNVIFDVNNVDASKMMILYAGHSTLINRIWIGTSDSRSSGALVAAARYPYSAAELGRMKIQTTVETDGALRSRFRSTVAADTEVFAVFALGPFETARFKDSEGHINVCRGVTPAGGVSQSSNEQYVAAILIP